jgi:large subunit ribosomal protein L13
LGKEILVIKGQRTPVLNKETAEREWVVVDAKGQTLGRLATQIADLLRGKNKPQFTPHVDCGDFVVLLNCASIVVTGSKLTDKFYYKHSGYPGGLKKTVLKDVLAKNPDRVIMHAVKGMLPKTRLAARQILKLKIYAGDTHPHSAQKLTPLQVGKEI